jgi:hypothetical protein
VLCREQDRLKKEMMERVENVAAEFRKVAHSQMAVTTQRTIRQNRAIDFFDRKSIFIENRFETCSGENGSGSDPTNYVNNIFSFPYKISKYVSQSTVCFHPKLNIGSGSASACAVLRSCENCPFQPGFSTNRF